MQKTIEIVLHPNHIADHDAYRQAAAKILHVPVEEITAVRIEKRSIDARSRMPVYRCTASVYLNEDLPAEMPAPEYKALKPEAKTVHIAGFGPAGMFAALRLIELGIKPVVFERGKTVRERRRDIRALMQEHLVNENSNYCFGEGGAGTFSDGKLYTRSNKRGDVGKILRALYAHGAIADILIDAHPHIGSNKLPGIVEAIRGTIIRCGGEVHFNSAVTDIDFKDGKLLGIRINNEYEASSKALILAVGHSARDIFRLFKNKGIYIEPKPFAVGVRIEHPQDFVNRVQYHSADAISVLPPASYSVSCQAAGKGVFSFCMCPGGIIVPASTAAEELVLNGMSVSRRNSLFANSGFVATVEEKDWRAEYKDDPLGGMYFQAEIERKAFLVSGSQAAPAQRVTDFYSDKYSSSLPKNSYIPGTISAELKEILPREIVAALRSGLALVNKKMKGFLSEEALMLAPETRTSSPVRIPRGKESGMHVEIEGLIPTGEGAGYAGGIVSAAIDGERGAEAAARYLGT